MELTTFNIIVAIVIATIIIDAFKEIKERYMLRKYCEVKKKEGGNWYK